MKYELSEEEKRIIIESTRQLRNYELLEGTLDLSGGDDYDGCFTHSGRFEFDCLQSELKKRLKAIGFLEGRRSKKSKKIPKLRKS